MTERDVQTTTELDVAVFGALTDVVGARTIRVRIALPCSATTFRRAVGDAIMTTVSHTDTSHVSTLLAQSTIADDTHVLADHDVIERTTSFAILPPVCGG